MTPSNSNSSKALHITLWIAQIILGLIFIIAGIIKSFISIKELSAFLPWVTQVPDGLVPFIGILELMAGIGLVLPSALRIRPGLTPLAAIYLAILMVIAMCFHITREEYEALPINVILLGAAVFIAWGRKKREIIIGKGYTPTKLN